MYEPFYSRDGELVTDILYFEAAYYVTKNPLYIWELIVFADKHREVIPPFVVAYLVECSSQILGIKVCEDKKAEDGYKSTREIGEHVARDILGTTIENYRDLADKDKRRGQYFRLTAFSEFLQRGARSTYDQDRAVSNMTDNKQDVFFNEEDPESSLDPDYYNYQYRLCIAQQKEMEKIAIKYEELKAERLNVGGV